MIPNVPGLSANFPEQDVRNAFSFAMQLGAPNDPADRVKFLRRSGTESFYMGSDETTPLDPTTVRKDRDGNPLNPNIRRVKDPDVEVEVECAIEVERADADELPVGNFRQTKAVVTLTDVEYAKVVGCRELTYNGDRYVYGYEPNVNGLFGIDVHTMIFYALDES